MRSWFYPVLVFLLFLIPRTLFLSAYPPLFYDEGILIQTGQYIHHGILGNPFVYPQNFPPIAPFLSSLLPTSFFWQRLPFALYGTFSGVLLFFLLRRYNLKLALASSILFSFSPVLFDNRTAELTNGTALLFLLSIYFFLHFKHPTFSSIHYTLSSNPKFLLLSGLAAGLSFSFNYLGFASILFVFFQTFISRLSFKQTLLWWSSTAAGLSVFFLFNFFIDGKYFLGDLLSYVIPNSSTTVSTTDPFSKLLFTFNSLLFGNAVGLVLPFTENLFLSLFTLMGFIATVLVLFTKRKTLSRDFLLAAFLSIIITFYVGSSLLYWVYFTILLPFYCLSIIVLLTDVKLPLRFIGTILLIFSLLSLLSFYGTISNYNSDFSSTVSWLSTNQHGLVAADPTIDSQLPYNTSVNLIIVIFSNHPFNYHEWNTFYASRLHGNLSLSRFSFIVIDPNIRNVAVQSPTVNSFIQNIQSNWTLSQTFGQYSVYQNPNSTLIFATTFNH